ncbi:MAG: hypothetical protein FH749_08450 [Firmicutes bacterium]|nr:hypothetical protein [Bacillota bacterium]
MKQKLVIFALLALLLTACASGTDSVATITFPELSERVGDSDDYDISAKAAELDGEIVEMVGYMSPLSPIDSHFFYMIQVPGAVCPFCDGSDVDFLQVVQVYAPGGRTVDYATHAVKVTGVFEVGEQVDEDNATSIFRIRADKIEEHK